MRTFKQDESVSLRRQRVWRAALLAGVALPLGAAAWAQEEPVTVSTPAAEGEARQDTVVVTGIRSSLASALSEKRAADNLIEVIQAEDIGKLPDQNLAEVLENITGVQITREAGVGTGVQIRGTNANRTEINGVSTVGSGSGRGGIRRLKVLWAGQSISEQFVRLTLLSVWRRYEFRARTAASQPMVSLPGSLGPMAINGQRTWVRSGPSSASATLSRTLPRFVLVQTAIT